MSRLRVATTIPASRGRVWADISDLGSHVEWMSEAREIRFVGRRRRGRGTAFDCDTRVGPLRLTDRMRVTSWVPRREIGIRHEGAVVGEGRFILERVGLRRTRFVWDERLRFPWWFGGPLGATLAGLVLRPIWRANLRRLSRRF